MARRLLASGPKLFCCPGDFGRIWPVCGQNEVKCTTCGMCTCNHIVGPANQNGCIILRVGNLADEKF
jgi:hypothetical protein